MSLNFLYAGHWIRITQTICSPRGEAESLEKPGRDGYIGAPKMGGGVWPASQNKFCTLYGFPALRTDQGPKAVLHSKEIRPTL